MSSSPRTDGKPRALAPEFHERVWGVDRLQPWFPDPPRKTGEVWFRDADSSILIKFLFTTENLSVQVHPDDTRARESGHCRGKTEMWHVLHAEPGAQIALGFAGPVSADQVRRAAGDGSIMALLRWIPVTAGDSFFVPAGAVHALGAGLTICEVQQNSDVTYRLFDYGRGRDLHLDQSLRVSDLGFTLEPIPRDAQVLVDCPLFRVEKAEVIVDGRLESANYGVAIEGRGTIGGLPFQRGTVWDLQDAPVHVTGDAKWLLITTKT